MGIETVRGKQVTVQFNGKRCIHARNCVLTHPDVFVPNTEGEWIHPDATTAEEVALTAHLCPSGAIQYCAPDGGALEPAPIVNTLRLRENGPLTINAPLQIAGQAEGFRATLCRCGQSRNKPYCDGSHVESGFSASGERAPKPSQALEARDGPVSVEPRHDGPLKVLGNLEIVTGTGHTIDRTQEVWLCRCGHSANKPYCDGSHRKSGFTAKGA